MSRSNFAKNCKKLKNWPYLKCYFTYRLQTWYQGTSRKCTFNDLSADDLDPRSRSKIKVNFSHKCVKNQRTGHISEAISPTDLILGTKVQPNKAHSMTQVSKVKGQGQFFSQNGLNTKQLATSLMLFHLQTSSYLLSQLFVTHLGVALLLYKLQTLQGCQVYPP